MTVKSIADKYGVSVQTVYKRIKAAGMAVEALKDKDTGELTEAGKAAVMALFKPLNEGLNEGLNWFKDENEKLKQERDALNLEVERFKAQVETMQAEIDYLRKALDQAQHLQAMALQRLALPAPRRSWWSKLFGRGGE